MNLVMKNVQHVNMEEIMKIIIVLPVILDLP